MNDYVDSQNVGRISIKEFRDKAREFHEIAKKSMRLPFTRTVFVATVCSAYELLVSNKKLTKFKIQVSTVQKIWRDFSVKTLAAYWREADKVIRASWPHSDVSHSHLVKWELLTMRYLDMVNPAVSDDLYGEVGYQVIACSDLFKGRYMEDLMYLLCTIELM